ncbi:hypothetical protein AMAG_17111 [Allomyces macrogynus ATCC 38327]|uniref:Uncharacterized protein n=1 Tax=Allomyces macrogynus (strain ATCC 38327) TaxID=578462 RepID=A0A0L0TCZ3_ALLM3|nr:hypothetical protein AMAG_17111 [Allomyces macrogynus ATCC 38327]|eukprot:KNE72783.1 hypothetical protein AMAG_17111 [Allomyces macrogynus ATCC 38327]
MIQGPAVDPVVELLCTILGSIDGAVGTMLYQFARMQAVHSTVAWVATQRVPSAALARAAMAPVPCSSNKTANTGKDDDSRASIDLDGLGWAADKIRTMLQEAASTAAA